jgi:hypothetical protein
MSSNPLSPIRQMLLHSAPVLRRIEVAAQGLLEIASSHKLMDGWDQVL